MKWIRVDHEVCSLRPDTVATHQAARQMLLDLAGHVTHPGFPGTDGTNLPNRLANRQHQFIAFRWCPH